MIHLHANQAGELITNLGGHPSLAIGPLLETHNHDIGTILRESLEHEKDSLNSYKLNQHKLNHVVITQMIIINTVIIL